MIWDSWCLGLARRYSVDLSGVTGNPRFRNLLFCVSPLLLGTVGPVQLLVGGGNGPNSLDLLGYLRGPMLSSAALVLETADPQEEGAGSSLMGGAGEYNDGREHSWQSHKWWLHFPCSDKMVILNMVDSVADINEARRTLKRRSTTGKMGVMGGAGGPIMYEGGKCPSVAVVPVQFGGKSVIVVSFDKSVRDEAVVALKFEGKHEGAELLVFNVNDAFITGKFTVLSTTKVEWRWPINCLKTLLFTNKLTGKRCFIITCEDFDDVNIVTAIEETTGETKVITAMPEAWVLTAVNHSLLCASDKWCHEIWDVNRTDSVVCKRPNKCDHGFATAESGLLIHNSSDPVLTVTEAISVVSRRRHWVRGSPSITSSHNRVLPDAGRLAAVRGTRAFHAPQVRPPQPRPPPLPLPLLSCRLPSAFLLSLATTPRPALGVVIVAAVDDLGLVAASRGGPLGTCASVCRRCCVVGPVHFLVGESTELVGQVRAPGGSSSTGLYVETADLEEEGSGSSLMGGVVEYEGEEGAWWQSHKWWLHYPAPDRMVILNMVDSVADINEARRVLKRRRTTGKMGGAIMGAGGRGITKEGEGECPSVAVVPVQFDGYSVSMVFFSSSVRDEAVIAVDKEGQGAKLLVFNVNDAFVTKKFTVLSTTKVEWAWPAICSNPLLFTKKLTGNRCFIAALGDDEVNVVNEIEETTGARKVITSVPRPTSLTAVNDSLLCAGDKWCHEIWDVNDTSASVCKRKNQCGIGCATAESGLLVHDSRETAFLAVTEPISSFCVLQVRHSDANCTYVTVARSFWH
ncbi:hypothetical protein Pelo_14552 [Pelomyxa schiedti]|nr:hypothetical protein Pelo_14551 [Pelomyxa schiedti]KAH3744052.1 hypothetical protein Pelo_14552 [Pelomyxa schiedti]